MLPAGIQLKTSYDKTSYNTVANYLFEEILTEGRDRAELPDQNNIEKLIWFISILPEEERLCRLLDLFNVLLEKEDLLGIQDLLQQQTKRNQDELSEFLADQWLKQGKLPLAICQAHSIENYGAKMRALGGIAAFFIRKGDVGAVKELMNDFTDKRDILLRAVRLLWPEKIVDTSHYQAVGELYIYAINQLEKVETIGELELGVWDLSETFVYLEFLSQESRVSEMISHIHDIAKSAGEGKINVLKSICTFLIVKDWLADTVPLVNIFSDSYEALMNSFFDSADKQEVLRKSVLQCQLEHAEIMGDHFHGIVGWAYSSITSERIN